MPYPSFLSSSKFSEEAVVYLENSGKAPKTMKIDPPLPAGYTAWIHRAGWVLYVYEPSKTCSWMHPGKLAQLEARGLKGPGQIGPEMHIWEQNVNRGGHHVVIYGYPPRGKIRKATKSTPIDFLDIDRKGYKAREAGEKLRMKAYAEAHREKIESGRMIHEEDKKTLPKEFWEMRRKVMREQGIACEDEEEVTNESLLKD